MIKAILKSVFLPKCYIGKSLESGVYSHTSPHQGYHRASYHLSLILLPCSRT